MSITAIVMICAVPTLLYCAYVLWQDAHTESH